MTTKIKPIPDGFHTLTAYLIARGASDAIEFYKKAFGATELFRLNTSDGKIAHGEFKIGDSIFMISDENPGCGSASPETLNGSPVTLHLYVADADPLFPTRSKQGPRKRCLSQINSGEIAWASWSILLAIIGSLPRTLKMWIRANSKAEWMLTARRTRRRTRREGV